MAWRTIVEKRDVELDPKLAAAIERARKGLEESDDWPKPGPPRPPWSPEAQEFVRQIMRDGTYRQAVQEVVRDDPEIQDDPDQQDL
jgi:hypothetical protein